ncbi:MAG: DUF6029 family protein [Bacteroidota bacterium]|nr:DUF6029 family protein [Bacteroidota bacterium]
MKKLLFLIFPLISIQFVFGQTDQGQVSGNFEINMQSYQTDSLINAIAPDDKVRTNAYANINYVRGKFSAGIRYEAYMNTMLGYDRRYDGHGLANRYVKYDGDFVEVTAGHFYEQFGNGLVLRAYEDKTLGWDNAIDGIRAVVKPYDGINITGLVGKQRKYWEYGNGIVRAADANIDINTLFKKLSDNKTKYVLAGSFVSKFEESNDPVYNFPENVGAFSGRFNISRGLFTISSEYAHKINDPSNDNGYIYKDGDALFINTSYSMKGFGILLSAMRLDNMSFRSERAASINDVAINYLPALSKTHTYALPAMYPFAGQPNGQVGFNTEVFYNFKRKSLLGGKYGTNISINYSQINSISTDKITIDPEAETPNLDGYTSDFFAVGDELYFKDFNFELHKKIDKSFKFSAIYMHEEYNKGVLQGTEDVLIEADIAVLDITYKLNYKHALRLETQALFTEQDLGDWMAGMLEYTFAPHWFLAVSDQYNFGNPDEKYRVHYLHTTAGYTKGSSRLEFGFGKRREGIVCVGGVCRNVPASNGISVRFSTSF